MSGHQASVMMWDKFDLLVTKTGNGLQVVKDFIDYFKKRAAIEAQYAKNLGDLAKETPGSGVFTKKAAVTDESKTLKNALLSGQTANSAISSHLVEFHTKLTNEVIKPLENFVKTKENERKKLVTDGQKFNKTVADAKQAVAKALDTYTRLNKDSDAARDALEKIPSTDTKKYPPAEKKVKEFEDKVKNAETAYQTGVDKFNESQTKSFSSDMPAVLDGLQQLEQDRFNELKSALIKYYELLATFPPFFNDRLTDMSKTINDDLSWDEDWTEWAESNKSANEKPDPIEFKAYEGKYSAAKDDKKEEKKEEPKKEEKKTEAKKEEPKKTEVKKEEPKKEEKKEEKKPEAKKEEPKKEEKKEEPKKEEPKKEEKKEEPKEEPKEEKEEPVVEKKSKDEEDIFG